MRDSPPPAAGRPTPTPLGQVARRPSDGGYDVRSLRLEVEAERGRRSLERFIRGPAPKGAEEPDGSLGGWKVHHPNTPLQWNWHHDALVEHLEAVEQGEIQRLVINVPPGMTKSMTASVYFPAWIWTREPSAQFLTASYGSKLSTRDAVRSRRVITSDWYQRRWGHRFDWSHDQVTKTRFENDEAGYRVTTSVGTGTGERADYLILDDPHNTEKVEGRAERMAALHWLDSTWSTRHNSEDSRDILIMQRLHERDATAHLLEQWGDDAVHLMLPMEYEPDRACVTVLGFEDPREEPGELLHPERKGREAVQREQRRLGAYGTAAQHQQRPTTREGGLFEEDWFKPLRQIDDVPPDCLWCRYWDKAGSEEDDASYTVGVLMGMSVTKESVWVADVARAQLTAGPREDLIDDVAEEDRRRLGGPHGLTVLVEQEGGSGGKDSALDTKRRLQKAGYRVEVDRVAGRGNKFARADPLSGAAEQGLVHVLDGPWAQAYVREMARAGPGAEFLDQMDASSGAYNWLSEQVVAFQGAVDRGPSDQGGEVRPAEDPDGLFGGIPEDEIGGGWL